MKNIVNVIKSKLLKSKVEICPVCGSDVIRNSTVIACENALDDNCIFRTYRCIEDVELNLDEHIYYMNDLNHRLLSVNSVGLGRNLESKFRYVLSSFVYKNGDIINTNYLDLVGVDDYDYSNGTDFILNYGDKSIRIDITARGYGKKDNLRLIKDFKSFSSYVRTGNVVRSFDNPVLVFVVPYYDEESIIEALMEIYLTMEINIMLFYRYIEENGLNKVKTFIPADSILIP